MLCFIIFEEVDEHESTEKVCKSDYGVGRRMPFEVNLKSPLKSSFNNNISVTDRSGLATNKPHGDLAVDLLNNIVIMGISVSHQIRLYLVTLSVQFSSVAQSCLTLRHHGLQHARPPCPSPAPRVYPNLCPLSR